MRGRKKLERKPATRGKDQPKFYCETCGSEVPANVDACPHCGMPFYAVKCPRCGYTGKAMEFVEGCPKCGYLAGSPAVASKPSRPANDAMPGWIFFLVLLLLGTMLAGLIVMYLNI